jgi:hypothetical protein
MRLPYISLSLSLSLCTCVHGNSPQSREQERVALQKGFVDYVIGPYYKLVAAAYPAVAPVFELTKQNRETWNRELSPPCVCACVRACVRVRVRVREDALFCGYVRLERCYAKSTRAYDHCPTVSRWRWWQHV